MTLAEDKPEEVHVDLWGPHNPLLLFGSIHASILVGEKSQKTWVLYPQSKDKFVDVFQIWISRVENKSKYLLKTLCANRGGEFISIKLRVFCKNKGIALKYAIPYMYEENGLAKRGWQTIITMKDLLLLDSGLPLDLWAEAMETANYLQNRQSKKSQRGDLIQKEAWTHK